MLEMFMAILQKFYQINKNWYINFNVQLAITIPLILFCMKLFKKIQLSLLSIAY